MGTTDEPPRPLTVAQLAREAGCCDKTIRRRIADGTLPAFKVGCEWRIRRADADAFMAPAPPDQRPAPRRSAK